jgi:hypothetical protein
MARAPHVYSGFPGQSVTLSGGHIRGQSSELDVVTIEGHSSQAGDLVAIGTYNVSATSDSNEKFIISSSGATQIRMKPIVAIASGSTAYTVLSSNSGSVHIVPGFSSGATITMPAHKDGLNYEFYIRAVTSSDGLTFALPSSPGTIYHGAVADGATIVAATAADLVGGSKIGMLSDGTNWYMSYSRPGSSAGEGITVAAT